MGTEIERRYVPATEVRVAKDEDGNPTAIEGYFAVFDSLSVDLGGFREKIEPGAFGANLKEDPDVVGLVDHDTSKILGRTTSGTLTLNEDKRGLLGKIDLPDTTAARDIAVSMERGDITGASFAFTTVSDRWETQDEEEIRTLEAVRLHDVSVVTRPAYPDTSLALRSLEAHRETTKPEDKGQAMRMRMAAELEEVE